MCLPSDASRNSYRLTWVSLTLDVGYLSLHGCSSKAQPLLLTLDEGYLLTATPLDLERGVAPLSAPAPVQRRSLFMGLLLSAAASDLRSGVARLGRRPSSEVGLLLSATTPDLGHRVAALGCVSARSVTAAAFLRSPWH